MKQDKDLAFLATCKNEDLRILCDILTHDKRGELRLSEQLTNSDAYIHYYPERMNMILKSASNLNGNLNCSKELEHYAS